MCSGRCSRSRAGYLFELIELVYSGTAQTQRLRLLAELSAWMAARDLEPAGLTALLINGYLEPLRARADR
jgi:hypothetical protein